MQNPIPGRRNLLLATLAGGGMAALPGAQAQAQAQAKDHVSLIRVFRLA
ncbi:hypothetical protein [Roseomonas gilardii]|nr:hypothetical protein [Roseomonas gilardii]